MTSDQIARHFRARRSGRGKWQAKCPAHEDRSPSLSITAMKDGTRIVCFAGCAQKDVLSSVGLDWRALKLDGYADPRAMAEAARQRIKEERKAAEKRKVLRSVAANLRLYEAEAGFYMQEMIHRNRFHGEYHTAIVRARFWCERWNSMSGLPRTEI